MVVLITFVSLFYEVEVMRGINRVTLYGFVGGEIKFHETPESKKFCNLNIGTPEEWIDSQSQPQERIEWHRCVLTGRQAEIARDYAQKKQWVMIEGRNKTREWTDPQGQKRFTTEVWVETFQLLHGGVSSQASAAAAQPAAAPQHSQQNSQRQHQQNSVSGQNQGRGNHSQANRSQPHNPQNRHAPQGGFSH